MDSTKLVKHTCPAVDSATESAEEKIFQAKDSLIESIRSETVSLLESSLETFPKKETYTQGDLLGLIHGIIDNLQISTKTSEAFDDSLYTAIKKVNETVKEQGTYKLREALDSVLEEKETVESSLEDSLAEVSSLENKVSDLESEIEDLKSSLEELQNSLEEKDSELSDANKSISDLEQEIDRLKSHDVAA